MSRYVAAFALCLAAVLGTLSSAADAHVHRAHAIRHAAPATWWRPDGYFVYGPHYWSFRYYSRYSWAGAGPFRYGRTPWPLGHDPRFVAP